MLVLVSFSFARRTCHAAEAQKFESSKEIVTLKNLFMSLKCDGRKGKGKKGKGRKRKGKGKRTRDMELTGRGEGERFVRSVPHTS